MYAAENYTPTAQGTNFRINTTPIGSVTPVTRFFIADDGKVGIGNVTAPTQPLDINGNTMRLRTARTISSATDTGAAGEICWNASYLFICTATNVWKRLALAW